MKAKTWLSSLAGFPIALVLASCDRAPDTVDNVIERTTTAMGGRQAIEAVHSVVVDLRIVDPDFAVDGSYRATRPGKMRIDVNAEGKHVFTEAFDGRRGWQWKGEGTTTIDESPKATAALRHGVELPGHLYGLHELRQRGHRIDLIGREKIDGIDCYALRLTLDDGYVRAVLGVFVDLHQKGLIYRGRRMINWDPSALTALSDEEVIPTKQKGSLYYVRYEIVEEPGRFLEVATTRPTPQPWPQSRRRTPPDEPS
jgi:hypothetical protein